MIKCDNCKNCVSRCEHAGKDREFVYSGEKSCKVLYTPERVTKAADMTPAESLKAMYNRRAANNMNY